MYEDGVLITKIMKRENITSRTVYKYLNLSDINVTHKRYITNSINTLKTKEERLFDFYLEGNINKQTYEAKKSEIESEKEELQKNAEKYVEINEELKQTIERALDITANAPMYIKISNPRQQKELLDILLTNCQLEGQKLTYTLPKPFNNLINKSDNKEWLDLQPNDLEYYEELSSKISELIKNKDF